MKILNAATFLTFFSSAVIAAATAAQPAAHTSRIESQRGEKWWGVFAGGSPVQPFENPFDVNTDEVSADGIRVPVLVSNAGRYLWSPQPITIDFDGDDFSISSDHEKVAVQHGGKNLREAYLVCAHKNFTPDGTLPPIDLLTMPVYNTRIELGYLASQDDLLGYAGKILDAGLPAGIILLSDGWRSGNGGFDFDREHFPDPRAMVGQLHAKGFKIMLTVTPFTGAFGRGYVAAKNENFFLQGSDGRPLIVETDGGYGVCFDLARPEVADYCRQRIAGLQSAYGIDGFRFDCRDILPQLAEARTENDKMFLENWRGLGVGIELCEYIPGAATPLVPTVHGVISDAYSGWQGLRRMMCNTLSAGLAGFPYVHASPQPTGDPRELFADDALMARSLQLCAWLPVAEIPFAPWRIGDPALRAETEKTIRLRAQMADYVAGLVRESARTGEPLLRHMEYQFPRNGFSDCNDQFMLGGKYLFAPIVGNDPARTVRLPRGVWTDPDGRRFKGPVVTNVNAADGKMIWFELSGK